jgi:hypothetical protein
MNPWLLILIQSLWHNLKRFAGVILIAVFCLGLPYLVYNKGYSRGYSKGYAQAIKDRPTYGSVGSVTNIANGSLRYAGLTLKLFFINLKMGI